MTSTLPLILIAALGGVAVALQGQFMGVLDRDVGTLESVFITYGLGGLLVGLAMLLARGGNLAAWQSVPWWALTSGVLGLVIVSTIGYAVPRLGLTVAFTIIIASQFVVTVAVDHFGLFGADVKLFDLNRLAGVGLVVTGVWLMTR